MPHIVIKMYPGRSEEQKRKLVNAIAEDIADIAKCELKLVSSSIEEVSSEEWKRIHLSLHNSNLSEEKGSDCGSEPRTAIAEVSKKRVQCFLYAEV